MADPYEEPIIDQVVARFPGIDVACDFIANWSWGIFPDVHVIETTVNHPPSADIGTYSLIALTSGKRLDMPNCRVAKVSSNGPGTLEVHFEDRRWAWATGSIDGDYNEFNLGTLQFVRPRTAQELATLCLNAMGEVGFDVSALPIDAKPRKHWAAANPAQELDQLATEYGCVVVLNPVTNRVSLCRPGQGAEVPDGPAIIRFPSGVAAPIPSQIRVIGATALFQSKFPLGRPLAREVDGRLVFLEEVSYTPAGGWGGCSPYSFNQIQGSTIINGERVYHRDLAQESVWRYHELMAPGTGIANGWDDYIRATYTAITGEPFISFDQLPPWLLDLYNLDGRQRQFAFGPFLSTLLEKDLITDARIQTQIFSASAFDVPDAMNQPAFSEWSGDFVFPDPSRPVIKTTKPLFRYDEGSWRPSQATGRVAVAHAIKSQGVPIRFEKWIDNTLATPAGPLLEYHDDVKFEHVHGDARIMGVGTTNNLDNCKAQADYYLNAMRATLAPRPGQTAQFPGLYLQAGLDGAIRRLVWSGGPNVDPTTTVARNTEPNPTVIPWEQRPARVAEKIAKMLDRRALANAEIGRIQLP